MEWLATSSRQQQKKIFIIPIGMRQRLEDKRWKAIKMISRNVAICLRQKQRKEIKRNTLRWEVELTFGWFLISINAQLWPMTREDRHNKNKNFFSFNLMTIYLFEHFYVNQDQLIVLSPIRRRRRRLHCCCCFLFFWVCILFPKKWVFWWSKSINISTKETTLHARGYQHNHEHGERTLATREVVTQHTF